MSNFKKAYAAYTYNDKIRSRSSSGGVFSVLAEYVINDMEGVVYGVEMANDCYTAAFARVSNTEELSRLRGSKYLQARVGDTFKMVKTDLESGIFVFFSGTPCQINGLCSFLSAKYENLLCVDVICHGVPSERLWKEHILNQEKKNGKLCSIDFRCKNYGITQLKYNEKYSPIRKDRYFQMFLKNYSLRPSCYECCAKSIRMSDLTLGDFWGGNKNVPNMFDNKGLSLVIVRTEKGEDVFERCKDKIRQKEVNYTEAIERNSAENKSVLRPGERDCFYSELNEFGFDYLVSKHLQISIKDKLSGCIIGFKKSVKRFLNLFSSISGLTFDTVSDYGLMYTYGERENDE